uniref:AlNc14C77G5149 protein n=1 Tax=Albugo laibachii Nc14 TaxID=890382 RepID=F0WEV0_9STRA|nr:AlNc14C77G5149 [Albugo laibachii Nc14]|eukprot:CCA19732.1 AlNc14C77G5149 [Albugo laibachii Nc14]
MRTCLQSRDSKFVLANNICPEFHVCEHAFTQSKPNNHIDSSEPQLGTELLARYARDGAREDSPHHPDPTGQAIRLFGVDIAPDAGIQESKNIKSNGENIGLTRYSAPAEHVICPTLKRSCSETSVMLVHYSGDNAQRSFESLALRYDVVMFSMTGHYVWMLCELEDAFGTEYCQNLRILKILQHKNVGSMQSLPAGSTLNHFEATTKSRKRK